MGAWSWRLGAAEVCLRRGNKYNHFFSNEFCYLTHAYKTHKTHKHITWTGLPASRPCSPPARRSDAASAVSDKGPARRGKHIYLSNYLFLSLSLSILYIYIYIYICLSAQDPDRKWSTVLPFSSCRGLARGPKKGGTVRVSTRQYRKLFLCRSWDTQMLLGVEATVRWVQYPLLGGDHMMHVEALQWPNRIFAGRLRANCHQLYELGNATKTIPPQTITGSGVPRRTRLLRTICMCVYMYIYIYIYTQIHTLHYITLHYITLHYITLHYITLHYITLHYITLHYITVRIQGVPRRAPRCRANK